MLINQTNMNMKLHVYLHKIETKKICFKMKKIIQVIIEKPLLTGNFANKTMQQLKKLTTKIKYLINKQYMDVKFRTL